MKSCISIIYIRFFFETIIVEEAGVIKEVLRVGSNEAAGEISDFKCLFFKVFFSIFLPPCSDDYTTGVVIFKSLNIVGMHTLPIT